MAIPVRIATFNLENLDDKPGKRPTLEDRIAVIRPQLLRLRADVLCLQEVNGQEQPGQPRQLLALDRLLEDTPYHDWPRVSTRTADGAQVYDERNLVIISRWPITTSQQIRHDYAQPPQYRKVTSQPEETESRDIGWERPILYAKIAVQNARELHVLNLHLKSRQPSYVEGQQLSRRTWRTASGWAEGFFISSMKRVGQALETRLFIDHLFDANPQALIAVCGDFNAEADEVPIEAIRGAVENTSNAALVGRELALCEATIPESTRYTLFHRGRGRMLDHLLVSRALLAGYRGCEVHNELLHDESIRDTDDKLFPESDHAPVVAEFTVT